MESLIEYLTPPNHKLNHQEHSHSKSCFLMCLAPTLRKHLKDPPPLSAAWMVQLRILSGQSSPITSFYLCKSVSVDMPWGEWWRRFSFSKVASQEAIRPKKKKTLENEATLYKKIAVQRIVIWQYLHQLYFLLQFSHFLFLCFFYPLHIKCFS